jgi:hypothetical protein
MGSQIYTRLPPCEGVWPVGGRASGYTPSQVPPRGGATSCLPRQLHLLTGWVVKMHSPLNSAFLVTEVLHRTYALCSQAHLTVASARTWR